MRVTVRERDGDECVGSCRLQSSSGSLSCDCEHFGTKFSLSLGVPVGQMERPGDVPPVGDMFSSPRRVGVDQAERMVTWGGGGF